MKTYFKFLLLLLVISTMVVACVKENPNENRETPRVDEVDSSTRAPSTGGAATCLFSDCAVTCPAGNVVSTGCSWGFAYCNCDAPATISSNNPIFIDQYKDFLVEHEFEQEVLQLVNNLSEIINNEMWEEYGIVLDNYNNVMESLPLEQQELAIEFIESNQ